MLGKPLKRAMLFVCLQTQLERAAADRASFHKVGQLQRDLGEKRKALRVMEKRAKVLETRLDLSPARDFVGVFECKMERAARSTKHHVALILSRLPTSSEEAQ